jgi:glutaredoxin
MAGSPRLAGQRPFPRRRPARRRVAGCPLGGPLIVIYSRQDCKYCERVKRDYLKPLVTNPRYRDRVVIRQINQDGDNQAVTDFNGIITTTPPSAAQKRSSWCRLLPSTDRTVANWPSPSLAPDYRTFIKPILRMPSNRLAP